MCLNIYPPQNDYISFNCEGKLDIATKYVIKTESDCKQQETESNKRINHSMKLCTVLEPLTGKVVNTLQDKSREVAFGSEACKCKLIS